MKVIGIIPARSGSKGVPNKNIKLLMGYPLMAYSIVASNLCNFIDETIVTTDSDKYIKVAKKYNADTIKRPNHLSNDTAGDIDYLLHLVYKLDMQPEDLIILLRPTTPLRDVKKMEHIWSQYKSDSGSMRSMHKLNESPKKMFKFINSEKCYIEPYMDVSIEDTNKPRQNFDNCYQPNGYMDIIEIKSILEDKTVYGNDVIGHDTGKVIEIDNVDDWKYLEYYAQKSNNSIYKYLKENYEPVE